MHDSSSTRDYELLAPVESGEARLVFQGPFEGKTITWDARLIALRNPDRRTDGPPGEAVRSYIEIGELSPRGRRLTVGLPVDDVDDSTIQRTIIMIRQYKRLRHGRHEFGDSPADG